ncbi:outer membrane beta-barrel protein [Luteimonas vadosa]|uniref:Outer membrane protein beta-barrel domain-containing protein n=1 Tax=Luteimonas vadosa TaxID=1165507 RepID=A0ABP9DPX9_9GAMM
MKALLTTSCALALASLSANALAVEGGTGFVRAAAGHSTVDVDVDGFGSDKDDDRTLQLGGGYYFTPNVAIEGFYANLYDYSEDGYSAKLTGLGLGVVARKNFGADNNGFYIAGRLGAFRSKGDASATGVGSASGNSVKPYFGVGIGYDFSSNFGLGLDYTSFRSDFDDEISVDARTLTFNAELRF